MTIIQDGMDQSKLKCPRVKERSSKMFDSLFRPALHLVASWVHGYILNFAVSDADLKKDSVTQIEIISRSLSSMYDDLGTLPSGFHLQQDNCYREGKNQYALAFMCLLVILNVFRWTVSGFLRSAHSRKLSIFANTIYYISRNQYCHT